MTTYEKILANGGSTAQLLGVALSECCPHFSYNEELGEVSCLTEAHLEVKRLELEEAKEKLKELEEKTPEDYRIELLKGLRHRIEERTERLHTRIAIRDAAQEKIAELGSLSSTNKNTQNALSTLVSELRTALWLANSDIKFLKSSTADLESKVDELLAWSEETRSAVCKELEKKIQEATATVERKAIQVVYNENVLRINTETLEAYREIAELCGMEVEEPAEKE